METYLAILFEKNGNILHGWYPMNFEYGILFLAWHGFNYPFNIAYTQWTCIRSMNLLLYFKCCFVWHFEHKNCFLHFQFFAIDFIIFIFISKCWIESCLDDCISKSWFKVSRFIFVSSLWRSKERGVHGLSCEWWNSIYILS